MRGQPIRANVFLWVAHCGPTKREQIRANWVYAFILLAHCWRADPAHVANAERRNDLRASIAKRRFASQWAGVFDPAEMQVCSKPIRGYIRRHHLHRECPDDEIVLQWGAVIIEANNLHFARVVCRKVVFA